MNTDSHRLKPKRVSRSFQRNDGRNPVFVFDVLAGIAQFRLIRCAAGDNKIAQVGVLRLAVPLHKQGKWPAMFRFFHARQRVTPLFLAGRVPHPNLRCRTQNEPVEILPHTKRDNFLAVDQDEMNADRARMVNSRDGMVAILLANFRSFDRHMNSMVNFTGIAKPI